MLRVLHAAQLQPTDILQLLMPGLGRAEQTGMVRGREVYSVSLRNGLHRLVQLSAELSRSLTSFLSRPAVLRVSEQLQS